MPIKISQTAIGIVVALAGIGVTLMFPNARWLGFIFIVLSIYIFIIFGVKREKQSLAAVGIIPILWIVFGSLVFLGGAFAIWHGVNLTWPPDNKTINPFKIEVRSALVSDSGPLTLFVVQYPSLFGQTVSPVFYLAYIRITNLQDIASTISIFEIAASKESTGPWEELVPIPISSTNLYMLGAKPTIPKVICMSHGTYRLATPMKVDDMKQAGLISAKPELEPEFMNAIPAHHTISGWIALDSRKRRGLTPGQIYLRIKIQDTAGKGGFYIIPLPIKKTSYLTTDANCGGLQVSGAVSDISKAHVKYYSDPFPNPK